MKFDTSLSIALGFVPLCSADRRAVDSRAAETLPDALVGMEDAVEWTTGTITVDNPVTVKGNFQTKTVVSIHNEHSLTVNHVPTAVSTVMHLPQTIVKTFRADGGAYPTGKQNNVPEHKRSVDTLSREAGAQTFHLSHLSTSARGKRHPHFLHARQTNYCGGNVYTLIGNELYMNGSLVSTNAGVKYQPLGPRYPVTGNIYTGFYLDSDSNLQWNSSYFPDGQAKFCIDPKGIIEAVFDSSAGPSPCQPVTLTAHPSTYCSNSPTSYNNSNNWTETSSGSSGPSSSYGIDGYVYMGCHIEYGDFNHLNGGQVTSIDDCASLCGSDTYNATLFGVTISDFGDGAVPWCYCADSFVPLEYTFDTTNVTNDVYNLEFTGQCDQVCPGNEEEHCGGALGTSWYSIWEKY